MTDKTGKFNFNFELKDFRCWKKGHSEIPSYWKFQDYKNHHQMDQPYMNNKNGHKENQCELYGCVDDYKVKKNEQFIRNSKNIFWICYKY